MTGGAPGPDGSPVDLTVVLPAYNEPGIERVVREVVALVHGLIPGRGEVVVVDDASTDDTPVTLARLAVELPTLTVLRQPVNQGHGPALIRGFGAARGAWIGHLDTDDQIPTAELARLWDAREGADLVLGSRVQRHDPRHRLVLTAFTRALMGRLAGTSVHDANVPCKLFTRELWDEVAPLVPADTFAPSLALVVVAFRRGRAVRVLEVRHQARLEGETTLRPARLARAVGRSTLQTVAVARRC